MDYTCWGARSEEIKKHLHGMKKGLLKNVSSDFQNSFHPSSLYLQVKF